MAMDNARKELGFAEMILRKGRPKKKKQPVIKKSDVEQKLLFEMGMREASQRLLSACSNPQQRLDAGKTILTSNSRTLALMTALQKEHVKEVEDAHGLTDLKDEEERLREEMLDSVSLAEVTISNLTIPLKWSRIDHNKYKSDCWKYQVFVLLRCGVQVLDSSSFVKVDLLTETVVIDDTFVIKDLGPDFVIDMEVYYTQTEDQKKKKKGDPADTSPPVFAIAATASLSLAHCNLWQQKQLLRNSCAGLPAHITSPLYLPDLPPLPVLNFYRAEIDVRPHFTNLPVKQGFLDVQHMESGTPDWVRSWCSLHGMYLKVWRRPEHEAAHEPTQIIEINEHMILDHIPRSTTQRPHTIHISYCKSPYSDHFLSCDSKEERILWEIALHKAMINSSTWHPNKLSCADNTGTYPSPLKSPPPKPPRPVTGPQFSYTPSNPCLPSYKGQYEAQRSSRKDKLLDWTPMKRSKSAERNKKTPAPAAPTHRARAFTSTKPNRRRSRSVDLTPIRKKPLFAETPTKANRYDSPAKRATNTPSSSRHVQKPRGRPTAEEATPKRDRVSDATYVSMHKYSRIPPQDDKNSLTRPNRPAPRAPQPPSLSRIPGSGRGNPGRPLSKANESYKAAVGDASSPSRNMSSSPRRSPRHQKLQVNLSGREQKKKAPTPCKKSDSPQKHSVKNSRHLKSVAPAAPGARREPVPRRSSGGTNNLNSPNRSNLRNKAPVMNLYLQTSVNDSEQSELSPSLKISNLGTPNTTSSHSTPSSFNFEIDNFIDDAFGSLQAETTGLSSDTTPSFHPAAAYRTSSLRSQDRIPGSPARRGGNSPAKTAKTPNRKVSRNTPLTSTMRDGAPEFALPGDMALIKGPQLASFKSSCKGIPSISGIAEEEEEEEVDQKEKQRERGDSLLDGYFDTSSIGSEDETEKENQTPSTFAESPVRAEVRAKRRSESPAKEACSPSKRVANRLTPKHTPMQKLKVSPIYQEVRKSPRNRSPLGCFKGTSTSSFKGVDSPSNTIPDSSPITVRPKPKFKVVNGKLMPI